MKVLAVIALFAIAFLAGCSSQPAPQTATPTPEASIAVSATPKTGQPSIETAEFKDCGSSVGCLADASSDCSKAKAVVSNELELFGVILSATSLTEVRGTDAGLCVFYSKTLNQSVRFSAEYKQKLLAEGKSEEEIAQQEREADTQAKATIGYQRTCKVTRAKLEAVLTNWKNGDFSTEDFSEKECAATIPPGYGK